MNSGLIINCKVACRWMRVRDNVLIFFSGILWVAMILALYQTEFRDFVSFGYAGVIVTIGGIIFLWSHFRKAAFRYSKKRPDRRSGYARLSPATVAGYFDMEEEYLGAMQQEKYMSIQHLQDGHIIVVSSYNLVKSPVLAPKKCVARWRAAA